MPIKVGLDVLDGRSGAVPGIGNGVLADEAGGAVPGIEGGALVGGGGAVKSGNGSSGLSSSLFLGIYPNGFGGGGGGCFGLNLAASETSSSARKHIADIGCCVGSTWWYQEQTRRQWQALHHGSHATPCVTIHC